MPIGDDLIELMGRATRSVLIVAPYMTFAATERLIRAVPPGVTELTLVTRWRADEVAAGASDLAVLDLCADRPGARLLLHPRLHAKLFKVDSISMIGSANVTERALGWAADANLELLKAIDDAGFIDVFVAELLKDAAPATEAIRDMVQANAAHVSPGSAPPRLWLPRCASPKDLWRIYSDQNTATVLATARDAGRGDLAALGMPAGLDEPAFVSELKMRFLSMPAVKHLLQHFTTPLQEGEGADLMRRCIPVEVIPYEEPGLAWEIFQRWLMRWAPREFRARPAAEEFVRGRHL